MLTRQMQIQAIVTWLEGEDPKQNWRLFDEPWRGAYEEMARFDGDRGDRIQRLMLVGALKRDELGEVLAWASKPLAFPSLEELSETLPDIEWLWPGWIPQGMITLLGGSPGAGKSFVALDLCRRIIAEETFPDGTRIERPGANVIYVDAEAVPQLLNQRAEAWQMDRSRIYLMLPPEGQMFIDFTTDEHRDHLVDMAFQLNPALIVVDSLSSISSKGENSVEDVRAVLGFLNLLAQEIQSGLVLNHHLRKRQGLSLAEVLSIDDFRGSGHIVAIARTVMGLTVVQTGAEYDRNGPRCLEVVKTNLAQYPGALGVEFVPMGEGVVLRYGDAPQAYREPTKTESCADWLMVLLEDGPLAPKVIVEQGGKQGYSQRTIYRARDVLGGMVVGTKGKRDPSNEWALEGWGSEE